MGTLYLVRHGQASFGAADYDNLSELGHRQSVRLGEYFAAKGTHFDAVFTGTLKRHTQTWAGMAQGAGLHLQPAPPLTPTQIPGLNEYDSEAVIATIHPQPLPAATTPEQYKHHFRLLRDGLTQWMNGVVSPRGMPRYCDFVQGVTAVLDQVRQQHTGNVLLVSSGGPIATAVGHILGAVPEKTIELTLQMRNSAVTEFLFTPRHHLLHTFNSLAHLDGAEYAPWITYA